MANKKESQYKEFYHYAKGAYEEGDTIEDLKKLVGEYCLISNPSENDIIQLLAIAVMETAIVDQLWIREFIEALNPNHWSYRFTEREPYNFNRCAIGFLLSRLSLAQVTKRTEEDVSHWIYNIGKPQSNVLKLKKRK